MVGERVSNHSGGLCDRYQLPITLCPSRAASFPDPRLVLTAGPLGRWPPNPLMNSTANHEGPLPIILSGSEHHPPQAVGTVTNSQMTIPNLRLPECPFPRRLYEIYVSERTRARPMNITTRGPHSGQEVAQTLIIAPRIRLYEVPAFPDERITSRPKESVSNS